MEEKVLQGTHQSCLLMLPSKRDRVTENKTLTRAKGASVVECLAPERRPCAPLQLSHVGGGASLNNSKFPRNTSNLNPGYSSRPSSPQI